MKNDKLLLTTCLGIISTVPAELLTQLFKYFGFGNYSIYQLASLLITLNRPTMLMGFIVDALVSSVIAFLFCYALEKLGSNYLLIKVTLASLLAWFVCELIFTIAFEGKYISIRPLSDYYSHILGACLFGIVLGLLFKKYLFKGKSA